MSFISIIETIERIDFLVRSRRTGCARQFADRMGVSKRTLFTYLNELRNLGAPVSWSKEYNSYIYEDEFFISLNFKYKKSGDKRL